VEIEWLILADSAQVIGNKLYMLGGGWDVLAVQKGLPIQQRCSVAFSIKVPWNETNQRHSFEIEMLSEDQKTEEPKSLMKMGGQFEVGRPPGIPQGQDQRFQLAIDMIISIDLPGIKTVIARIDSIESKRIQFNVVAGSTRIK
jgi:hypothetical protein